MEVYNLFITLVVSQGDPNSKCIEFTGGLEETATGVDWEQLGVTGCEFDCITEQNAPHFRHFARQISACIAVFTM